MEESTSQQNQPQGVSPQTPNLQKNTGMAIVAYILFFIPLFTEAKKDPLVKYHIKQGLIIFVGWFAIGIIGWILGSIPYIWYLGSIISRLLNLAWVILMIIGIMNAAKGEQKPLPVVGKFGEQFKF